MQKKKKEARLMAFSVLYLIAVHSLIRPYSSNQANQRNNAARPVGGSAQQLTNRGLPNQVNPEDVVDSESEPEIQCKCKVAAMPTRVERPDGRAWTVYTCGRSQLNILSCAYNHVVMDNKVSRGAGRIAPKTKRR
jgi:hypothetical protein